MHFCTYLYSSGKIRQQFLQWASHFRRFIRWHLRLVLNVRIFLLRRLNNLFSKSNLQYLFCQLKENEHFFAFSIWWGSSCTKLTKKLSVVIWLITEISFNYLIIFNRQLLMKRACGMVCLFTHICTIFSHLGLF